MKPLITPTLFPGTKVRILADDLELVIDSKKFATTEIEHDDKKFVLTINFQDFIDFKL